MLPGTRYSSEPAGGSLTLRVAALAIATLAVFPGCDRDPTDESPDLSGIWVGVASPPMTAIGVPSGFEGPFDGTLEVSVTLVENDGTVLGSGSFTWSAPPESEVGFVLFKTYSESVTLEGLFLSAAKRVEVIVDRVDMDAAEPVGYSGVVQETSISGRMNGMELADNECCMVEVGAFDLTLTRR